MSEPCPDLAFRIAAVTEAATNTLGCREKALLWISTPSVMLRGEPLLLISSDAGYQAVMDELTRIEFGDLT